MRGRLENQLRSENTKGLLNCSSFFWNLPVFCANLVSLMRFFLGLLYIWFMFRGYERKYGIE